MRLLCVSTLAASLIVSSAALAQPAPYHLIRAGMTISEVQALMGPPQAIKSLREREAMFYCPQSWFDLVFGDRTSTVVWLNRRRVVAAQSHRSLQHVTCEDVVAAFQWTDPVPVDARATFRSHEEAR